MKILHLEDSARDAELVRDLLRLEWPDCFVSVVATRDDFVSLLQLGGYDLVLSDFDLPGFDGLEALMIVRRTAPDIPFIFVSGALGEERAIDVVRAGAADYVIKDRLARLTLAVQRVLRESQERRRQRETEEALAKEQYLLRLLMENLPEQVYFKDLQSSFISVNRAKAQAHGLEPAQLRGKSDFDFTDPEFARSSFADEQRIIRTGEPLVEAEERVRRRDGSIGWVASTKLPLRDASGAIVGTFGISRDITARRAAEERIREQADIINEAPVAILIIDLQHRITYANAGAAALYGTSCEALVGQAAEQFLSPEALQHFGGNEGSGRWTGVVPVLPPHGRERQAEVHVSRIPGDDGRARANLCIAIDVTEKKQLEEQFLRAQRLESLGMLAAGIAHDLNNVLAPVLMGAPLLRGSNLPASDLRVLEAIELSAARGAALVRQILSFAHGAGGELVLVQFKHLVRDVTSLVRQSFAKSIRIVQDLPTNLWTTYGNPTQLHQVILNLCVNARDAMPDGGTLELAARNELVDEARCADLPGARPGPFVVLEVADTGTGISAAILNRIWDPFFTTKGHGKGTGLGLATVRGIVASHNGFIELRTIVGRGTTFRVFFPAADAGEKVAPSLPVTGKVAARGAGELLLVVDDEATVRELLAAVLSRAGFRVLVATSGAEALAVYAKRQAEVALVITDLDMPEMRGPRLVELLRQINPDIKVLYMTGGDDASAAPIVPHQPLLTKPFAADVLLQHVQALLGAR